MTKQTLANIRVSSTEVNVEQINGKETTLAYLQLTARGAKAYADGTVPTMGMTIWGGLTEGSFPLMGIKPNEIGVPALMIKAFDNTGSNEFAEADFSCFYTILPEGDEEIDATQDAIAKFRLVEDDRAVFRGDSRGTLVKLYDQVELRNVTYQDEQWLQMVGIKA